MNTNVKIRVMLTLLLATSMSAFAQVDGEIMWKKNFGGEGQEQFRSITAVDDGFVVVGDGDSYYSAGYTFGTGDWEGISRKGNIDAIIVKFDNNGNAVWKSNFGGSGADIYYSVTKISDGVVAVGSSQQSSFTNFGNGDWVGTQGRGGAYSTDDAIIVKYDNEGNVVWKKNFGGNNQDRYFSVTTVSDGIVAAGMAVIGTYENGWTGTGDWEGFTGETNGDAIIVKYDNEGNVVWKKNFGGSSFDRFNSVATVSDGVVVVGKSGKSSFGNGDWEGYTAKGEEDAIIIKYDNNGNIVWKKHFGGQADEFISVTTVSDGIVAVGNTFFSDYGNGPGSGDWEGFTGKGAYDVSIVKYNNDGEVLWKRTFGGRNYDYVYSVTAVSNGIIMAGESTEQSFGYGDWEGTNGKGMTDAIIVKYDNIGNVVWKKNFGGNGGDRYETVTTVSDNIVAAGFSIHSSFGTGDWIGFTAKGTEPNPPDGIIVKYFIEAVEEFIHVTNITNVPSTTTTGTPLILTGMVEPSSATNQTIVWSVSPDNTLADVSVSENTFTATTTGTAKVRATITNGLTENSDYEQDFEITVGTTGIVEMLHDAFLRVLPNPANNTLNVELTNPVTNGTLMLYDMNGKIVLSQVINGTSAQVNISSLSAGNYILRLVENGTARRGGIQVIKQ